MVANVTVCTLCSLCGVFAGKTYLCDPHLNALAVRFLRRGAIQIYVYLVKHLGTDLPTLKLRYTSENCVFVMLMLS